MTQPMPAVADLPTDKPGLGFEEYVDALADAVRGGEPPQFTIGLYGAWGSGKSSLLKAMAAALERSDSDVLPLIFDAWRHERDEHIIVPLLYRICEAASRSGDKLLAQHLKRAIKALIFSLNFTVAGVGIDTKEAKEAWDSDVAPLDAAFSKPFEEMRRLPETLGEKRIAVLVDDLDRCSPEKVVSLLEAINLVMDVPGFIFVLALDYGVLVKAVSAKYPHVSGHEFIEKMIQLPFRVPPLNVDADEFLAELIPRWKTLQAEFPKGFDALVSDIADIGLRSNPRQIKRMINSFLVLDRIADQRALDLDRDMMAALIALQLRWPEQYQDLQDAVMMLDGKPFDALGTEDENLERFRKRFFATEPPARALREILQLTAVVATESATSEKRLVSEVRAEMRELLLERLTEKGFSPSARSERIWYHPQLSDFRIALTKVGFRFEETAARSWGTSWALAKSFDYRQAELALNIIEGLLQENSD
jgi:energy-coupling factor transporter ATP-binding protein EcfA2